MLITIIWLNLLYTLTPGIVAPSLLSDCDKPSMSGFNFMKEIIINSPKYGKKIVQVDDEDYEFLSRWKWHVIKQDKLFYACRTEYNNGNPFNVRMHRVILNLTNPKKEGEHADRNSLNNQRYNLRIATRSQNAANIHSRRGSSSKYLGVSWCNYYNKWRATVRKNGVNIHAGYFKIETDAALAYNRKAIEIHGEFANPNIIT